MLDNPCAQARQVDYIAKFVVQELHFQKKIVVNLPWLCAGVVSHSGNPQNCQAAEISKFRKKVEKKIKIKS